MRHIATVLGLALAGVLAACASTSSHTSNHTSQPRKPQPLTDARSGHASDLVVHNGDTVEMSGEVLALPGAPVRACAAVVSDGMEGRYDPCEGIDVTGVNVDTLTSRHESAGRVVGWATLTGTYEGDGTVAVTAQGPPREEVGYRPHDKPPCRAPTGGWPHNGAGLNLNLGPIEHYQHDHPGQILMIALLRPSADQVLGYALTSGDPVSVRAALVPDFDQPLCVARSRYTNDEVDRARDALEATMHPTGLSAPDGVGGKGLASDAQFQVSVRVAVMSADLASVIDAQPDGLVDATVWLTPVR